MYSSFLEESKNKWMFNYRLGQPFIQQNVKENNSSQLY